MDIVLGQLTHSVFYMDDVLVGGLDEEDLFKNLLEVLEKLAQHNLKIQLSKIDFYVKEVKILGVIFSSAGKKPDPEKIKSIQDFPIPTSIKECQRFLGMLAFLSSFIPNYSTRLFPVFSLLKDQKNKKFQMTKEAIDSITEIKDFLSKEILLYNIDFKKPLYIVTDASNYGYGGMCYQV